MTAPWPSTLSVAGRDKGSVRQAIARAAERTGVDFGYLLAQAKSESGLDPGARAGTSSAAGLYQFIDQSWLGVLKQHGEEHGFGWASNAIQRQGDRWTVDPAARSAVFALRHDPDASALMAGAFASDNAAGLQKALGREPTRADLYFAHFLGLQGASRFLRAADAYPDAAAASVFPREAGANRAIFYRKSGEPRSLVQVYQLMARKVEGGPGAPDGSVDNPIRMATYRQAGSTDRVKLVDVPASAAASDSRDTMLALGGQQQRMNMLRPDPRYAMLAYMLVASPMDSGGDGDGGLI